MSSINPVYYSEEQVSQYPYGMPLTDIGVAQPCLSGHNLHGCTGIPVRLHPRHA